MSFFEGQLADDERSPAGWYRVAGTKSVFVQPDKGEVVITGEPSRLHSCDRRGCGSLEHRIAAFEVPDGRDVFYPIRKAEESISTTTGDPE